MHTVFCRNIIDYGLVNIYKYWKQQKKFIILIFKIIDFVLQWYTASDNESYPVSWFLIRTYLRIGTNSVSQLSVSDSVCVQVLVNEKCESRNLSYPLKGCNWWVAK